MVVEVGKVSIKFDFEWKYMIKLYKDAKRKMAKPRVSIFDKPGLASTEIWMNIILDVKRKWFSNKRIS